MNTYFDQNITNFLKTHKNFRNVIYRKYKLKNSYVMSSTGSFFEFIGYKEILRTFKPKINFADFKNTQEAFNYIYDETFKTAFSALSQQDLLDRLNKQLTYVNDPLMKKDFTNLYKNFVKPEQHKGLCEVIAWETVMDYVDTTADIKTQVLWFDMVDRNIVHNLKTGNSNLGFYRAANRWKMNDADSVINKKFKLRPREDYADSEIIHYLVCGLRRGTSFYRVKFITLDSYEVIKERLNTYSDFLNMIKRKAHLDFNLNKYLGTVIVVEYDHERKTFNNFKDVKVKDMIE